MHLISPKPPWNAILVPPGTVRLRTSSPREKAWHLLRVQIPGRDGAPPRLKKGYNAAGSSYLLPGGQPGCWELVFFHAQPVSTLHLDMPGLASEPGEIRVWVSSISRPRAVARMMRAVSQADRAKGIDPTRIYRKSWARWRRHGWDGFLLRLVREYQPQEVLSVAVGDPYRSWIETAEVPEFAESHTIQQTLSALPHRPLLSVFLRAGGARESLLRKSIASVLSQSYGHLELCIQLDPAGSNEGVPREYADRDPRVRLGSLDATPTPRGDYVAPLHPGDELGDHALLHFARAIGMHPDALLLYSDEDSIDGEGRRFAPHFKPDWNPDLFLSYNYLSDLCLIERHLWATAGGISGGQDSGGYSLLLTLSHLTSREIIHIPRILYHRRTAPGRKEKGSAHPPLSALRDHFNALGRPDVRLEAGEAPGTSRVVYPLPAPPPRVSLLIPTRDRRELVETCVRSILEKTNYPDFELLILDNQSQKPDTLDFFREIQRDDERVRVLLYDHPFNYSAINNFGVRHATGEILGLVNNDIEVITPGWLDEMVRHACRPEIGCIGAKLYYPDDTVQHGGVIVGLWGVAGHSHKHFPRSDAGYFNRLSVVQNYSAVTAACLLVRRRIYDEVGGLDEANLPVSFNDVDFCLKVREAGYRNLWTPYAELYHHESVSRGSDDTPEKKERERREIEYMKAKWGEALQRDPCYSPNLTRHMENFSINLDHILFPKPAGSKPATDDR